MKKKIKRFVPTLLVMVFLAGMVVFAEDSYSFYMSPGAYSYTTYVTKATDRSYAIVKTNMTLGKVVRYTVLDDNMNVVSNTQKATGNQTVYPSYVDNISDITITSGKLLKLRLQNNTTDNSGGYISVSGSWTP